MLDKSKNPLEKRSYALRYKVHNIFSDNCLRIILRDFIDNNPVNAATASLGSGINGFIREFLACLEGRSQIQMETAQVAQNVFHISTHPRCRAHFVGESNSQSRESCVPTAFRFGAAGG
jgi:hypothetical protein